MSEKNQVNILLVDDHKENLVTLEQVLEDLEVHIFKVTSGNDALALMLSVDFALVLMDVQMPVMDGFETARLMRGSARTRHIPIIFITAINKEKRHIFKGYGSGAVDYLFKPLEPEILRSKVLVFTEMYRQKIALEEITHKLEKTISELIVSKENLRKAKSEAEQASKTKSEFLANMSHELRTPLNGIIGMAELSLLGELNEIQKERVRSIKVSGESLLDILNEILDISKIEADKLLLESIEFSLFELVEKAMKVLRVKANEKNINLYCDIDPVVGDKFIGDPVRLRQVILNLMGNAIKFTHEGYVMLSIGVAAKSSEITRLEISIRDTGIGIPEDKIETLFETFSQADTSTSRKYGGTGLGLPISKKLIGMMGGDIRVETEPGSGSNFIFEVELGNSRAKPDKRWNIDTGYKVIVAEGAEISRSIFSNILDAWGIEFKTVDSTENLMQLMAGLKDKNVPDYIFIDYDLVSEPESFALPSQQTLKGKLPEIILVTDESRLDKLPRLNGYDIKKIIKKPVLASSLLRLFNPAYFEDLEKKVPAGSGNGTNGLKLNILLAEDNLINQKLAVGFIKLNNWKVTVANNGKEAVEFAAQNNYDLILMDVQMPEMDGLEATMNIRKLETGAKTPIIAMTAHAMKGDKDKCLSAGMDDYLTKPLSSKNLFDMINKHFS